MEVLFAVLRGTHPLILNLSMVLMYIYILRKVQVQLTHKVVRYEAFMVMKIRGEDEGSIIISNISIPLYHYMVSQTRRQVHSQGYYIMNFNHVKATIKLPLCLNNMPK
jgi:hypothetical protein